MPIRNSTKLTDTFIRKTVKPPDQGRIEIFDNQEDSLCLRVSATGSMSWSVYYRIGGKNRKFTIGAYPTYSIAEAREEAASAKKQAAKGLDPVAERKAAQAASLAASNNAQANSVEAMASLFIERYVERRLKVSTAKDYKAHFTRYIFPAWKGRSVASINKKDVIALLDKIEDHAPIQANRVQATISRWFSWLMDDRDVIEFSPVARMKKRTPEKVRNRTLEDEEIQAIWHACDEMGWPFGVINKLLLLTAKRRAEVAGMRWSEIDLKKKLWLIPGGRNGRTKNKFSDAVTLSDQALELLQSLPRFEDRDLVFPAKGNEQNPVSGFSKAKMKMDKLSGVENWKIHDLRRSVRSRLAALSIRKEVADKVLHHIDQSVDGKHYDWHDYLPEKRAALQAWANELDGILSDKGHKNVVLLRGAL